MIRDLIHHFDTLRSLHLIRNSRHTRALEDCPAGLYEFWENSPHSDARNTRGLYFFTRATEGLLEFFACASSDTLPCALPSLAADSVWQAWTRFSPGRLDAFCQKHFGRTIPCLAYGGHGADLASALARTLAHASAHKGMPRMASELPPLFTLDRRLRMPRGLFYSSKQGRLFYQYLGMEGKPGGTYYFLDTLDGSAGRAPQVAFSRSAARWPRVSHGSSANLELAFGDAEQITQSPPSMALRQSN